MSATSYYIQDTLYVRSQNAKPGVKKLIKSNLSRAARKQAKRKLAEELLTLPPVLSVTDLQNLTPEELDVYADALLLASRPEDEVSCYDEEFDSVMDALSDEPQSIPLNLQGSLPDWMLLQLEDANGDAFASLTLFEAKRPSPKAAISMEDEALYA